MEKALVIKNPTAYRWCQGVFLCFLLQCIISGSVSGQAKKFTEQDLEKLHEAETLKTEGEEAQVKANEVYLEAAMLQQSDEYEDSKKLHKQFNKLEGQAQKHETDAVEAFAESNEIKVTIYKKYINDFWDTFEGDPSTLINAKLIEETGNEYLFRGTSARDDAEKTSDPYESNLKLSEAYELELIGLEKLDQAYDIYTSWPDLPGEKDPIPNESEETEQRVYDPSTEETESLTNTIVSPGEYEPINTIVEETSLPKENTVSELNSETDLPTFSQETGEVYIPDNEDTPKSVESYSSDEPPAETRSLTDAYASNQEIISVDSIPTEPAITNENTVSEVDGETDLPTFSQETDKIYIPDAKDAPKAIDNNFSDDQSGKTEEFQPATSSTTVTLNEEQLDKYKNFLKSPETDTNAVLENRITGFDMASVEEFWSDYKNVSYTPSSQAQNIDNKINNENFLESK